MLLSPHHHFCQMKNLESKDENQSSCFKEYFPSIEMQSCVFQKMSSPFQSCKRLLNVGFYSKLFSPCFHPKGMSTYKIAHDEEYTATSIVRPWRSPIDQSTFLLHKPHNYDIPCCAKFNHQYSVLIQNEFNPQTFLKKKSQQPWMQKIYTTAP